MCYLYTPSAILFNPISSNNAIQYSSQGPSTTSDIFTADIRVKVTFEGLDNTFSLIKGYVFGTLRII